MNSGLDQIIETLLTCTNGRTEIIHESFRAKRIGRNRVWKIDTVDRPTRFVKLWSDPIDFRRARRGLQLASQLAAQSPSFMAAEIIRADEESGVIVTKAMLGQTFAEILRRAYRLDLNPFGQSAAVQESHQCLLRILEWLATLHAQRSVTTLHLLNHTRAGIRDRIYRKLDYLQAMKISHMDEVLCSAKRLCDSMESVACRIATDSKTDSKKDTGDSTATAKSKNCLLFGDVSPANFVFDGNRIGVIDFEDFGIGNPDRDRFVLDYHLGRVDQSWHYRSCAKLRNAIEQGDTRLTSIYELEAKLIQVVNTTLKEGRPKSAASFHKALKKLKKYVGQGLKNLGSEPQVSHSRRVTLSS